MRNGELEHRLGGARCELYSTHSGNANYTNQRAGTPARRLSACRTARYPPWRRGCANQRATASRAMFTSATRLHESARCWLTTRRGASLRTARCPPRRRGCANRRVTASRAMFTSATRLHKSARRCITARRAGERLMRCAAGCANGNSCDVFQAMYVRSYFPNIYAL